MIQWVKQVGIRNAFKFGAYDRIMLSQAVCGLGLVENAELLKLLLKSSPPSACYCTQI